MRAWRWVDEDGQRAAAGDGPPWPRSGLRWPTMPQKWSEVVHHDTGWLQTTSRNISKCQGACWETQGASRLELLGRVLRYWSFFWWTDKLEGLRTDWWMDWWDCPHAGRIWCWRRHGHQGKVLARFCSTSDTKPSQKSKAEVHGGVTQGQLDLSVSPSIS